MIYDSDHLKSLKINCKRKYYMNEYFIYATVIYLYISIFFQFLENSL